MIDTVSSAVSLNELVFNIFILFKITKINNFHTFFLFFSGFLSWICVHSPVFPVTVFLQVFHCEFSLSHILMDWIMISLDSKQPPYSVIVGIF